MTVINGIEIDNITYITNEIKAAIQNNDPIDTHLHCIIVCSNPCQYARRYILAREFIKRFEEQEENVILYVVELAHGKQRFHITDPKNPRHLQIKTDTAPLWHKENMVNIGVRELLPKNWRAMAWIDADLEFESPSWAMDTLKILNGSRDVVQLFSHALDMDYDEKTMTTFSSFGFDYSKKRPYDTKSDYRGWHPGYAWACNRKAYDRMGGLFEASILGAGDRNMAMSFLGKGQSSLNQLVSQDYMDSVLEFQKRIKGLRLGYVPGVIRHYFHGSKKNRKYVERWKILVNHKYSPKLHLTKSEIGLWVPTAECPQQMLQDIANYFAERNEDEGLLERIRGV